MNEVWISNRHDGVIIVVGEFILTNLPQQKKSIVSFFLETESSNKKVIIMGTEDDEEEEMIVTSKLQLVLAASSPVISHHVSLSLLSSPDDLSHSRASVPFSWEEKPGKPKQHTLLLRGAPPNYPNHLHLPPRLLLPDEPTKMHLASDHPHHLATLKRWFRWKKDRANDDDVTGNFSFVRHFTGKWK
ncbi:hypothetical protein Bca101_098442 [Brassica carinata]